MNINLNKKILDILACPICKQDIEIKEDKIICKKCKKEYFIKNGKPIIAWILRLKFPVRKDTIITWGDTIYSEVWIPSHQIVHEQVHIKQQRGSKIYGLWFMLKFIFSVSFRLRSELEAYRAQYRASGEHLGRMSRCLSGKLYGSIISYKEAVKQIKR